MKRINLPIVALLFATTMNAQPPKELESIKTEIQSIAKEQRSILNELELLRKADKAQENQINSLTKQEKSTQAEINSLTVRQKELAAMADSLSRNISSLAANQDDDRSRFSKELGDTKSTMTENYNSMGTRTKWGVGLLVLTILGFGAYLFVRRRNDSNSMDEVRKAQEALQTAQEALQTAQAKMQEDSVKLDNQMISLIEKQMNATPVVAAAETDHSLALKVADEIVRIELNLSRMDSSVKGYKQLSKAVERIKNNFQANGYEIVDMLGKPYSEGMKVVANFVPDENLKEGEQVITGVTKPQINYNGKMIQSAQITVSQNI